MRKVNVNSYNFLFAEMQAANLMLEVRSREDDLSAAKQRCDGLETYVQEILAQNEEFRLQVRPGS